MTRTITSATARTVVADGRELVHLGGCSYLGLAHDARVAEAAARAARELGTSSAAARATTGTFDLHRELESELAAFCGAEDAALLPDTALADLAVALALVPRGARVVTDRDAHPCIVDALRAVGADLRACDLDDGRALADASVAFVDGTFPTAARTAPVEALRRAGLRLVAIDDAHGFGLLGERGAGAAERLDLAGERDVLVVALSKCLGAAGGAVAGSHANVERVRATSPHACTTAPAPPLVAAALTALRIVRDEPERRARALENAARLHAIVDAHARGPERAVLFPVRAIVPRDEAHAAALARAFDRADLLVPRMRYPGGPAPEYFRVVVNAAHRPADLERLADALGATGGA